MLSEEKIERIKMLGRNQVSTAGIATEVGTDRKTVRKYLGIQLPLGERDGYALPEFPEHRDGYALPEFPGHGQMQQTAYPMYQRQRPRMNAEMAEIISDLDRYDVAYGIEPQTQQERYQEEEKIRRWQGKRREEKRMHQLEMDELRNSRYRYSHYAR